MYAPSARTRRVQRLLGRSVRLLGTDPRAARVLRAGYRALALGAAHALTRHSEVDGVYATGSVTRADKIHPGYSDIDLVVLTRIPTASVEADLRERLRRDLGAASALTGVFKHIDYIEVEDLPYLRRLGDAWSLDLDATWQFLAGANRLGERVTVPPAKRRLEQLMSALRRWQGSSSMLADTENGRGVASNLIGARRTLVDALSAWLDRPRLEPLPELLQAIGARSFNCDALRLFARDPERAAICDPNTVTDLVVASLEVLEQFASEVTRNWSDEWLPLFERSSPPAAREDSQTDNFLRAARRKGFASACVATSRYGQAMQVVLAEGGGPRDAVLALQSLLAALRETRKGWDRPLLLTAPLWRAAALLPRVPVTGDELAACRHPSWARAVNPPRRPSSADWDDVLVGRCVQMLWVPRGRTLRARTPRHAALRKMAYEVRVIAPALQALLAGESPPVTGADIRRASDRILIDELRAWYEDTRPLLRARLRDQCAE
ncbi:MAG TPA: hypothetical protein VK524_13520 [Polyangiaceae bacterium]|nr:hypothetical protein [Polyangiaceae bacterium]